VSFAVPGCGGWGRRWFWQTVRLETAEHEDASDGGNVQYDGGANEAEHEGREEQQRTVKEAFAKKTHEATDGSSENEEKTESQDPEREDADHEEPDASLQQSVAFWFRHEVLRLQDAGSDADDGRLSAARSRSLSLGRQALRSLGSAAYAVRMRGENGRSGAGRGAPSMGGSGGGGDGGGPPDEGPGGGCTPRQT